MNRTLAQIRGHLAWLWLGVPLLAGPAGAEGVRLVPVASASLLGGQYFLDDKNGVRLDYTHHDFMKSEDTADVWAVAYTRKF